MRRVLDFAADNGFGSFHAVNLFAYRASNPSELHALDVAQAVGPACDEHIEKLLSSENVTAVCCAWGALSTVSRRLQQRAQSVLALISRVQAALPVPFKVLCLNVTQRCYPKHPLYIKKGTRMRPYAFCQRTHDEAVLRQKEAAKLRALNKRDAAGASPQEATCLLLSTPESAGCPPFLASTPESPNNIQNISGEKRQLPLARDLAEERVEERVEERLEEVVERRVEEMAAEVLDVIMEERVEEVMECRVEERADGGICKRQRRPNPRYADSGLI